MCLICDGYTLDEVLTHYEAMIAAEGFIVQRVGEPGGTGWAYTVGLIDAVDHPEMIIAGAEVQKSGQLLQYLGDAVLIGERFEVGDEIHLDAEVAQIGAVHPVQYRGDTFTTWHDIAMRGAMRNRQLDVVQVLVPSTWTIAGRRQPILTHPFAKVATTSRRQGGGGRARRKR